MTKPKKTDNYYKQTIKALRSELDAMRAELEKYSRENSRLMALIKEREEVLKEWQDDWKKSQAKRFALKKMITISLNAFQHAENILEG